MTGPEHYQAAESLLDNATEADGGSAAERYYLDAAQVHATLALAAATAAQWVIPGPTGQTAAEWRRAGIIPPKDTP